MRSAPSARDLCAGGEGFGGIARDIRRHVSVQTGPCDQMFASWGRGAGRGGNRNLQAQIAAYASGDGKQPEQAAIDQRDARRPRKPISLTRHDLRIIVGWSGGRELLESRC